MRLRDYGIFFTGAVRHKGRERLFEYRDFDFSSPLSTLDFLEFGTDVLYNGFDVYQIHKDLTGKEDVRLDIIEILLEHFGLYSEIRLVYKLCEMKNQIVASNKRI